MLASWNENERLGRENMRGMTLLAVLGLSIGLAACEGSAAGSCSTVEDVGTKLTVLTDDLESARAAGKIDPTTAGEIAAKIVEAGTKYGMESDHRSYCGALDKVRKEAGL
jgi:hypothetical protein